jgi:hypothetical protein
LDSKGIWNKVPVGRNEPEFSIHNFLLKEAKDKQKERNQARALDFKIRKKLD